MRRGSLDIAYGVALLGFGGFLWWETTKPKYADTMGMGAATDPALYPRILLGVWLAAAAALLVRGIVRRGPEVPEQLWGRLVLFVLLTGAYTWLTTALGFFLASVALCISVMLALDFHRWPVVAAMGVGFPLAVWYAFVHILQIPLPASPWFDRI